MHGANTIASRHDRERVSSDAFASVLSGASSHRGSGTAGAYGVCGIIEDGGVRTVTTDDVIGICDEYLSDPLVPGTTFPVDTLDGDFWADSLAGDLDDDTLDPESFFRDPLEEQRPERHCADDMEQTSVRKSGDMVRMTKSELEALDRVGRYNQLGPILDDSAMKFLESNPSYGNFGTPSPESTFAYDALAGQFSATGMKLDRVDELSAMSIARDVSAKIGMPNGASGSSVRTNEIEGELGDRPPISSTYSGLPQPETRLARLKRWKEKRKNRNFTKVIRYQSRKACADNRPRIKGKFVKVMSVPDLSKIREESSPADSDEEFEKAESDEKNDDIAKLGLDKGLSAPRPLSRLKKGLVSSMSMPDFSVYATMD